MTKKQTHGGQREGAGRPADNYERKLVQVAYANKREERIVSSLSTRERTLAMIKYFKETSMEIVHDVYAPNSNKRMARVAEIGGKFYPYIFDLSNAQIYSGNEFAQHSAGGIKAICPAYDTKSEAIAQLPDWGK